jgi:prophage antirepressor-like protein
MEIVKAFNSNGLHANISIKGTIEHPLFRSSDIGLILELSNIRSTINDYDKNEKVVLPVDTPGGIQKVSFLTEKGLFRILYNSKQPMAKIFRDWVCEVIHEIRLTGQYKLNKENDELISREPEMGVFCSLFTKQLIMTSYKKSLLQFIKTTTYYR